MFIVPKLGNRQKDGKFKAGLGYIMPPVSKQHKKKERNVLRSSLEKYFLFSF
jgi:hypothetical protein